MNDVITMYRRMTVINRNSAREWRELAKDAPPGLALLMLTYAEIDDMEAKADELRASQLEKPEMN